MFYDDEALFTGTKAYHEQDHREEVVQAYHEVGQLVLHEVEEVQAWNEVLERDWHVLVEVVQVCHALEEVPDLHEALELDEMLELDEVLELDEDEMLHKYQYQ